jgi:LmbE family N-acetylglucosaminyl deacetylase
VEAARFWAKLTKSDLPGTPHHPERLYYYYCVHLKHNAQPSFVLDISEQFERKMNSIRCYASQFIVGRSSDSPTFLDQLRDEASYWGKLIGTKFGEPFASREPIALRGFRELF